MASGEPPAILVLETNGDDQLAIVWIVMGLVPLASFDLCLRDNWILDHVSVVAAGQLIERARTRQ
jgi:hypothetical protein